MKILTAPNPILKNKAKKISSINDGVKKLIKDMVSTLRENSGIGLSAPQIGTPLRLIIIESKGDKNHKGKERPKIPLIILINPEIIKKSSDEEVTEEGCLSLPGIWGEVPRAKKITVKSLNDKGKLIKIKAEGLGARVLQHEIDHLDGILFPERVVDLSTLHKIDENGEIIPVGLPKL